MLQSTGSQRVGHNRATELKANKRQKQVLNSDLKS